MNQTSTASPSFPSRELSTAGGRTGTNNPLNGETDHPPVIYEDPNMIVRSPFNRQVDTKSAAFQELVASVKSKGVIEPLIVRQPVDLKGSGGRYELIAGERRWRAAMSVKVESVPIMVREATDTEVIELQTIENEQRQDLSPIEQAEKYQQLIEQYKKAGAEEGTAITLLCTRVGKARSTVYEALRLLKLPEPIKEAVTSGKLPASHAGVIAREKDPVKQEQLAKEAIGRSFRQVKASVPRQRKSKPSGVEQRGWTELTAKLTDFLTTHESRLGESWRQRIEPIFKLYRRRWQSGHAKKGGKK